MNRCVIFLAILAICVSGALSIPQEADPIVTEYDYDDVIPIDCEWGDWGPCSATCGKGKQQRTIAYEAVDGGENCTEPATRECTSPTPCPIDCKWGQWETCSSSCGKGIQKRVIVQHAQNGGGSCPGPAFQDCNLGPCPIDCRWGQWGACSSTCGKGIQKRVVVQQAQNDGGACPGRAVQDCNLRPCPIDCKWGQWGACSTTCGNGNQDRKVEIQAQYGGGPCLGDARRNCNVRPCPKNISPRELKSFNLCKNWQSYPGYHIPNPDNCKTYYQCQVNDRTKGGYDAILKNCGKGTGFDPSLGICNDLMSSCIIEQELKTPCVIQLFSQKELQGNSKGQINRSQWVFTEDNDDDDDNDVYNDDNDDYDDDNDDDNDDNDGNVNVKSVNSLSDRSGKCCWDVYSSSSKYKLMATIKPGKWNIDISGNFYLKKRLCNRRESKASSRIISRIY